MCIYIWRPILLRDAGNAISEHKETIGMRYWSVWSRILTTTRRKENINRWNSGEGSGCEFRKNTMVEEVATNS